MSYTPIPKKKVVSVNASSDTTVPASSTETITIQPPQGKIWKILDFAIEIRPPEGATSGEHRLDIYASCYANWSNIRFTKSYNEDIYSYHIVTNSGTGENLLDMLIRARGWKASHDYPFYVQYFNLTDVEQNNIRKVYLLIEEEDGAT